MKKMRPIIEIDEALCNGCGQCVPSCEEGAIQIINGKARLVAEKLCDGLGACLGTCPTGALKVVERSADAFDEAAVTAAGGSPAPSSCPSARMQVFRKSTEASPTTAEAPSELQHWPVQLRLVQPEAPFLKGADLLVAADCVPVAYAGFHSELLRDRVVAMGCPKFDDMREGLEKFIAIFQKANLKSLTVVVMQVPCCQGLPSVVRTAQDLAGVSIPTELVVVSLEGEILSREKLAA